jgi:serine/threonine protein kinase
MMSKSGEIKLIDFGLSKQQRGNHKLKTMLGTPYYMAPEIVLGKPYTSKVDMWSLGVLLYVFMSGYLPFQAASNN